MDRRKFFKLSAAAALFTMLPGKLTAMPALRNSGRWKVTVVRRACFTDLQSCYLDDPETGCCTAFPDGYTAELNVGATPPYGFCPKAWSALQVAVEEGSGCADLTHGKHILASCGDPTRPVVFKIELIG